jgi:protocatechuate 3,4-dioxygenase beta subunit
VSYPGRTPHIHFSIAAPGRERLITQMYVAGEAQNERDGILNGIRDARQRASVIVKLEAADRLEAGALAGTFDVVLGS